jgi:hypothetical protein
MTIEDIIKSMAEKTSTRFNQHTVRVTMSKMAARGFLIKKTGKRIGYSKIYKKRDDIQDQWKWMLEHKSPKGNLPTRAPGSALTGGRNPDSEKYHLIGDCIVQMLHGMRMREDYVCQLENLGEQLDQMDSRLRKLKRAAQRNTELLEQIRSQRAQDHV